jgi:NOT2 / NOT3 / NOT5 family
MSFFSFFFSLLFRTTNIIYLHVFILSCLTFCLFSSINLSLYFCLHIFFTSFFRIADHLTKFQIETIFYLFYSMPKDLLQACAAQELYRREWRYHGELRLWLKMRTQQELLQVQPNILFLYFDVSGWEARLFTSQYRGNIASGLLTEEEVRVKAPTHSQVSIANPGAS